MVEVVGSVGVDVRVVVRLSVVRIGMVFFVLLLYGYFRGSGVVEFEGVLVGYYFRCGVVSVGYRWGFWYFIVVLFVGLIVVIVC